LPQEACQHAELILH